MNIDFKAKPYFLNDEDISWVKKTLNEMTEKEKVGQLFCILIKDIPVGDMIKTMRDLDFNPGSYMTDVFSAEKVRENFSLLQAESKIPLLFACNLERGADGICKEGTLYGTQMQTAATADEKYGYELGRVCGEEAAVCGANWNFGPVVDIDSNFHNPITGTRTFGSDPKQVLAFSKAFIKGQQDSGLAVCLKHWPGDGQDERDQHMLTSINSLSVEDWDKTYGRIYKNLIDSGAETIMAAHILQPAYSKFLNPDLKESDILPGSCSFELTHTLLRERLGFNGVVVTDATTMTGFMQVMARKEALPTVINAGCDCILFALDMAEDFSTVMEAVENGIISKERLDEAVCRILAFKAHLNLPKKLSENMMIPSEPARSLFPDNRNVKSAEDCADKAITLVKDTQSLLPLSVDKYPKVLLHVLGDEGGYHDPIRNLSKEFVFFMKEEGFEITVYDSKKPDMLPIGNSVENMAHRFDLIVYYCSVKTSGSDTVSRITWSAPGGCNTPRYINEIPTLFISVDSPYMLFDVPQVKTYINGYTPNPYVIKAIVEKIMGRSTFQGTNPVDPFCGLFDARY